MGKDTDRRGQAAVVKGKADPFTAFGQGARGLQRRKGSRKPYWPPSGRLSGTVSGLLQGQAGEPQDRGGLELYLQEKEVETEIRLLLDSEAT